MKHFGYFKDGKAHCNSLRLATEALIAKGVTHFVATIEEFKGKRSNPQNAYYHGVVKDAIHKGLRAMGHDVTIEETHLFLKVRFNPIEVVDAVTGEITRLPGSTAKLNTEEFGYFLDRCIQYAAEYLGVVIAPPNEQLKLETAA